MIDKSVEELLIRAVHSDNVAKQFFKSNLSDRSLLEKIIAIVEESESGDARMKGAYWISQFDEALLAHVEPQLLKLMDDEWDSVAVHIMLAISKIKSEQALEKILDNRVKPVLYWEALAIKNYLTK